MAAVLKDAVDVERARWAKVETIYTVGSPGARSVVFMLEDGYFGAEGRQGIGQVIVGFAMKTLITVD